MGIKEYSIGGINPHSCLRSEQFCFGLHLERLSGFNPIFHI